MLDSTAPMKTLTPRHGDRVTIGPDVVVHYFRDKRGRPKLGIEAPKALDVQLERPKPPRRPRRAR